MKYLGEIEKSMNYSIITYYMLLWIKSLIVSIIVKYYNPFNVKDNDLISKIKIKFLFP